MKTIEYFIAAYGFLALSLLCLLLIIIGLQNVLTKTDYTSTEKKKIVTGTVIAFLSWLVYASILAYKGVIQEFEALPPRMLLIIAPPLIVAIYLMISGKADKILRVTPMKWMLYIQSFRIPVEIFLWMLYTVNIVPEQMTFEGLNYDILSGIFGIVTGIVYSRHKSAIVFFSYNIAGMLLLINIVTIAIMSIPGPFRVFMNAPANTVVTTFPAVMLPAVLVPLAYYMHLFSLRKWYLEKKSGL